MLALIYATVGRALRPLEQLSSALERVGDGDYTAHVAEAGPEDLKPIYRAFNQMAERLRTSEQHNQRLNEQLSTVQEEERSEISRDLHDEIGPFLFAADVDAQAIPLLVSRDASSEIVERSKAIRQSVQHMQVHLRGILSRLRPTLPDRPGADNRSRTACGVLESAAAEHRLYDGYRRRTIPGRHRRSRVPNLTGRHEQCRAARTAVGNWTYGAASA